MREEGDGHTTATAPHKKWQFWKQSGEKKPQKFGWITGVLVSPYLYIPVCNMYVHVHVCAVYIDICTICTCVFVHAHVCYMYVHMKKTLSWWGQTSQRSLDSSCFKLVSSHQQGIRITCQARHPQLYIQ